MANHQGRIEKRRDVDRRGAASRVSRLRPTVEGLESRRLLTIAINEFGGSATLQNTAGITNGPDGNLWFTQVGSPLNPGGGAIGRITPSGAIQLYTTGLSAGSLPTGITAGPDDALWFTEYGASTTSPLLSGASKIGRIDPITGKITEFSTNLTPSSGPTQITVGPDQNLWFTEKAGDRIGRITPQGVITEFSTGLSPNGQPVGIASGPDGALWFAESGTDLIGRITTGGSITEYGAGIISPNSAPTGITVGPDNNLWFTELGSSTNPAGGLGRITVQGAITQFTAGLTAGSGPAGIASGPGGNLEFTEQNSGFIGQITTQGAISEFGQNNPTSGPAAITLGPDGNLWFTELNGTHVDRITPRGALAQFPPAVTISSSNSVLGIATGSDGNLWFAEEGSSGGAIGRMTTAGVIAEFSQGLPSGSSPFGIAAGPDGNLWFTDDGAQSIGRITTSGVITEYPIPSFGGVPSSPKSITAGPDGNLWFTNSSGLFAMGGSFIGRITPQGVITEYGAGLPGSSFNTINTQGITAGPDGNLWFANTYANANGGVGSAVGMITPQGAIKQFPLSDPGSSPTDIATGADGALYFTEGNSALGNIGRITTAGVITQFPAIFPGPLQSPSGIVLGPDNFLYFVESNNGGAGSSIGNSVDRLNADGSFTTIAIPTTQAAPLSMTVGTDGNLYFTEAAVFFQDSVQPPLSQIGQVILPQTSIVAVPTATLILDAGQPFTRTLVNFNDFSTAAKATNFAATIDFGDSTAFDSGSIAVPGTGPGFSALGSHVYATAGQYTISVFITNQAGDSAPIRLLAVVNAPPSNPYLVTNTNDTGRGSLRQAILNANGAVGATISFAIPAALTNAASGVATIVPLSALPALVRPTRIDGLSQATFAGKAAPAILVQVDGRQTAGTAGLILGTGSAGSVLQGLSLFGFAGAQVEIDEDNERVSDCDLGLPADSSSASIAAATATRVGSEGVLIRGANAVIGGLAPQDRNVISGNADHGVVFAGPGAVGGLVLGNYVGTNFAGTAGSPNLGHGVVVIGGAGGLTVKFNLISGNAGNGIELYRSSGNVIGGNLIGTDVSGGSALGNLGSGICIDAGSSGNVVGGAAGLTNVISANGVAGVAIQSGSSTNVVSGNRIGTNSAGNAGVGNGSTGVLISESANNRVGPGNVVSGNGSARAGAGIWIDGTTATGNRVIGNHVGTDLAGEAAVPNAKVGVLVNEAPANAIVGNLVSGNSDVGIELAGLGATANAVQSNVIGVDAGGLRAIGNGGSSLGVGLYLLNAPGNFIGGSSIDLGNVISGNNFDGVELFGPGAAGNLLQFNRIGTDGSGTGPLGNAVDGLVFDGTPANRVVSNYVAANGRNGVFLSASTNVRLELNAIGLGVGGEPLGNGAFGILIGNKSTGTKSLGNLNLNNRLGAVRDTDDSPTSSTITTTTTASTSATAQKTVKLKKTTQAKHPVKVQPASKSFGGRRPARAGVTGKA